MSDRKEQAARRVDAFRERHPRLDHVIRMWQHYGEVKGNIQAGGVTYFGFLSFFPILAIGFFAVGWLAKVYPDAQGDLVAAIEAVLPGLVTMDGADNTIALSTIQDNAAAVGWVGLAGVLFAGLGWLSAMRDALLLMFEKEPGERPNFLVGKARDLLTLLLIGLVLVVSVAVSSVISAASRDVLSWLGLGDGLDWGLKALTLVIGLLASMVLFYAMFRLLAAPDVPARALWSGALLGAVGFEVLKRLAGLLMASTKSQPAFQAFGIALVLLVWIYYFARVVLYAAAWAHTAPSARRARETAESSEPASVDPAPATDGTALAARVEEARTLTPTELVARRTPPPPSTPAPAASRQQAVPFAAGAAVGLVLGWLLRRS